MYPWANGAGNETQDTQKEGMDHSLVPFSAPGFGQGEDAASPYMLDT